MSACDRCRQHLRCAPLDGESLCSLCHETWQRGYEAALLDAMAGRFFGEDDAGASADDIAEEAAAWDGVRR